MLAIVHGDILSCQDGVAIIVTSGGMGYEVRVGPQFKGNKASSIFTWLVISETDHILYGFQSLKERELAKLVAETDGIGPKLAHKLVTTLGCDQIVGAVKNNDSKGLSGVRGFGPKLIEALLRTLRAMGRFETGFTDSRVITAREALLGLGWEAQKYDTLLSEVSTEKPGATASELMNEVLVRLRLRDAS